MGYTKSCGCLCKTLSYDNNHINHNNPYNKKYNKYDLTGEYGIGYTNKGEEFYFDLEDYNKIKDYCWRINKGGYVVTTTNKNDKKTLFFHRLIMNPEETNSVDHIYHNRNDNRKSQLRIVSIQQNNFNNQMYRNNTSGIKGVYWNKKANKWQANIQVNNILIHLGLFVDKNEAAKARKQAEEKYFGEYAYKENEEKDKLINN